MSTGNVSTGIGSTGKVSTGTGSTGSVTDLVEGVVGDVTGDTGTGTGTGGTSSGGSATLTWAQAKVQCLLNPANLLSDNLLTKCIADLLAG